MDRKVYIGIGLFLVLLLAALAFFRGSDVLKNEAWNPNTKMQSSQYAAANKDLDEAAAAIDATGAEISALEQDLSAFEEEASLDEIDALLKGVDAIK